MKGGRVLLPPNTWLKEMLVKPVTYWQAISYAIADHALLDFFKGL